MSARDELATAICRALDEVVAGVASGPISTDFLVADALLAAGYRKPRIITTDEELDEVATLTVIRSLDGVILERNFGWWQEPGTRDLTSSDDIPIPATVLYDPSTP